MECLTAGYPIEMTAKTVFFHVDPLIIWMLLHILINDFLKQNLRVKDGSTINSSTNFDSFSC